MEVAKGVATDAVIRSIIDQVKESQLKLGYADETVRLYYLASSMALLCGREGDPNAADAEELAHALSSASELRVTPLGSLSFEAVRGNRVCVRVPPEGVRHVHEQVPAPPFLEALIALFADGGHCGRADVEGLFARFGPFSCTDMPADAGFDYMVRFDDPAIDPYRYCFKEEMGHTIYHRFAEGDFCLRWPSSR